MRCCKFSILKFIISAYPKGAGQNTLSVTLLGRKGIPCVREFVLNTNQAAFHDTNTFRKGPPSKTSMLIIYEIPIPNPRARRKKSNPMPRAQSALTINSFPLTQLDPGWWRRFSSMSSDEVYRRSRPDALVCPSTRRRRVTEARQCPRRSSWSCREPCRALAWPRYVPVEHRWAHG